ncbi:hypothetical protein HHI36_016059 [Cryptolaemus montrouzieri]|uniref:Gamma-tubulin complex component 6 n=1 Tax=Cryptolaemus montrouzieri TaxID=559131 RepID=A0ABD2N7C5_9CUCU
MEIDNTIGINKLINCLCDKFTKDSSKLKSLRSKCYELLLGKTTANREEKFKNLSTDDPFCNLSAWQYVLSHHYSLPKCAEQIADYHQFICQSYETNNESDLYKSVLKFLLNLRDIPVIHDDQMSLSILPEFNCNWDFQKLFRLPASLTSQETDDINHLFRIKPNKNQSTFNTLHTKKSSGSSKLSCKTSSELFQSKKNDETLKHGEEDNMNIWEIAATERYSNRRNWENYGYPEPEKEPIFMTELGDLSSLWIDNLYSIHITRLYRDGVVLRPEVKCRRNFIKDLKYLLVGVASESFTYNDFGELILIPQITLEGITEQSLEVYTRAFTLSGTCYKALNEISVPDSHTNKYRCAGFIFAELCESLNKYLQFYRTAIMSISDSMNLLEFSEKTKDLRKQITTLASICKVGPYKESEEMPHGVALLNYLYQKISEVIDKKTILMLYSILFPCCQIYFGRFILQWILYGSVNDPYDEFFIKTNLKYIVTRGRTYWTRGFTLRQDIIPDFLNDLKDSILLCGKMMNLLKLCNPFSKLCVFLMGKKPRIVSCSVTRDQLIVLEQSAQTYYLEASEVCGPKLSLALIIQKEKELNEDLLNYISKKRAVTLKRIELERQKSAQEEYDRKLEERAMLKEQYDMALNQKQFHILQDIERDIKLTEKSIQIERKREKLIQQEAKDLIEYYDQLFKLSDARREKIEKHIEILKHCQLDPDLKYQRQEQILEKTSDDDIKSGEDLESDSNNTDHKLPDVTIGESYQKMDEEIHSSISLDEINANLCETKDEVQVVKEDNGNDRSPTNDNFKQTLENFEMAKRNKQKVLTQELGIGVEVTTKSQIPPKLDTTKLTDAQRNKLKVMSSEFDVKITPRERIDRDITISDINKYKMMNSTIFCNDKKLDNENILNENIIERAKNNETPLIAQREKSKREKLETEKSVSLNLNFNFKKETKDFLETEKYLPMSVDSTPLSEIASISTTTSKVIFNEDKHNLGSFPTTAGTEMTDEGFLFNENYNVPEQQIFQDEKTVFSKVFSSEDVKNIKPMCLKMFLSKSLSYSLAVQSKLVSSELLSYFINDLKYLQHLKNLKNYFFLQDGEFGISMTETLFHKLYTVKFPVELINCRVLSYVIHGALEDTKRHDVNNLSFKINALPDSFNLGDVDVLNCLSLTYRIDWPLNILLPSDAIGKYNEVFRFLLKINRMHWILKKLFSKLRMLAKEVGSKEQYLMVSEHYRRIHQFRYIMMHFVQTLQNYVNGEIFQRNWAVFEKSLENVTNLDELYSAHTHYVKNILFMCLLNQRSAPLKRVLDKIFTVISKFYDHLRSKKWECKDGSFVHPSFSKLEGIFQNFKELVFYLFKVGKKVVKNGYQPLFKHFLDSLNVNGYYSNIANS